MKRPRHRDLDIAHKQVRIGSGPKGGLSVNLSGVERVRKGDRTEMERNGENSPIHPDDIGTFLRNVCEKC